MQIGQIFKEIFTISIVDCAGFLIYSRFELIDLEHRSRGFSIYSAVLVHVCSFCIILSVFSSPAWRNC
ncbi:hypothetical protein HRI_002496600 [Hibiscus trionum]|uniref:Uncharacterized protein n=1 Tax=Hibiscus trionum TaxID=183268 RepID=A0A9W7I3F1_HIBTR|nr:hypothetical protein HRI_002496600 [Hibiscus trionum]